MPVKATQRGTSPVMSTQAFAFPERAMDKGRYIEPLP